MSPGNIGPSYNQSIGSHGTSSMQGFEGNFINKDFLPSSNTTDYENIVTSIIENPKIDKRLLL